LEAAFEKFEHVVALVNDVTRQIENREKNITLLESIETSIVIEFYDLIVLGFTAFE
jgi:hypothetical protein